MIESRLWVSEVADARVRTPADALPRAALPSGHHHVEIRPIVWAAPARLALDRKDLREKTAFFVGLPCVCPEPVWAK